MQSRRGALTLLVVAVGVGSWIVAGRPSVRETLAEPSDRTAADLVDIPLGSIVSGDPFLRNVAGEPGTVHVALVAGTARLVSAEPG